MSEGKHPGGRPPKYKTVDEMQKLIDQYFEDCKGKPYTDKEGNAVLDKFGRPVIIGAMHPTVTGLALALGFTSRQALLNYQDKQEFVDTVTCAKAVIESYAEGKLYEAGIANGAKFSLTNNFKGWSDKSEVINHNLNDDISDLTDDERKARLESLLNLIKD